MDRIITRRHATNALLLTSNSYCNHLTMSLIAITKDMKTPDRKTVLVRSDPKNALLTRTLRESWSELSGLSWIFLDDEIISTQSNYSTMKN